MGSVGGIVRAAPVELSPQQKDRKRLRARVARVQAGVLEARVHLDKFAHLIMPDPIDIDDAELSQYVMTPLSKVLFDTLEKVGRRELKQVAVSVGPQLGKSLAISTLAPAWYSGRNPAGHMMLGSYNQDKANEFGDDVRTICNTETYRKVFPEHAFRKGSEAKNYLVTTAGGKLSFVGVGGTGSGKPADIFIIDDPYRNDEDAQSKIYRDKVWSWFNKVAYARLHNNSAIIVVHTRWHEDDLIGRLCDPDHPERNGEYAGIADDWTYINLPAVVTGDALAGALGLELEVPTHPLVIQQFGRKPMVSLWEDRKGLEFLARARRNDKRGFDSLYMGKPSPDDGEYFKADWLVEYDRHELPSTLVKYGASDHAVSTAQGADFTVMGCVGVCEDGYIWVLPELVWDRMDTGRTVDEMLTQMLIHSPPVWWMESELISKSFGPFLKKRMIETETYTTLDEVVPSKDKPTRARAIQGRLSMKRVRFPRFAPWWQNARQQMLKFPHSTNDDFVDWISHIGMGLTKQRVASSDKPKGNVIRVGSFAWMKAASEARKKGEKMRKMAGGF